MRFISHHAKHRIVIKPIRKIIVQGEVTKTEGSDAQFENGVYETTDKEKIKYLLNYDRCGIDYFPDVSQEKLMELEAKKKESVDESPAETTEEKKSKFKIGRGKRKKG